MSVTQKPLKRERQAELGQFLTPPALADFIASFFEPLPPVVKLLDAGAGLGALTLAFVKRLIEDPGEVNTVDADIYELDVLMQTGLTENLRYCEHLCAASNIKFIYTLHFTDFIQEMSLRLTQGLFMESPPLFNIAIINPPYRKIHADSAERRALSAVGIKTSNLYTGFIALIQRLLVDGGQLTAITPRSFCNGSYFRSFRESFLRELRLRRIHVFESRNAAFLEEDVLQENIIFHAIKGYNRSCDGVTISASNGEAASPITQTDYSYDEIVIPGDRERFIHIPASSAHTMAKQNLAGLTKTLDALGVMVSTGRVVDFRLKDALRQTPEAGTVPLIYPCHFNAGSVDWPRLESRKPNAILDNETTRTWLVPAGIYVLTKRFTSKEERRRLVACLLYPDKIKSEWLGFENHLNYFHANGRGLERNLALGLWLFLNSTVIDLYFRRFSGHTQVNATDLRKLPYPDKQSLELMGSKLERLDMTQAEIDMIVNGYLNVR